MPNFTIFSMASCRNSWSVPRSFDKISYFFHEFLTKFMIFFFFPTIWWNSVLFWERLTRFAVFFCKWLMKFVDFSVIVSQNWRLIEELHNYFHDQVTNGFCGIQLKIYNLKNSVGRITCPYLVLAVTYLNNPQTTDLTIGIQNDSVLNTSANCAHRCHWLQSRCTSQLLKKNDYAEITDWLKNK